MIMISYRNSEGKLVRRDGGTLAWRNNTIAGVIEAYAPRNENNTDAYIAAVTRSTGLSASTVMNTLTERERESIVNAITRIEGWKEGAEHNLD